MLLDKTTHTYIYAFLSRLFEKEIDDRLLKDLKNRKSIVEMISPSLLNLFESKDHDKLLEELEVDFVSMFVMNYTQPIETAVLDDRDEILQGLQNPVMRFYSLHGYKIDFDKTYIQAPDHISLEFGFMQNLIQNDQILIAKDFLQKHILQWIPSYLLSMKETAQSEFYASLCEFAAEFVLASYDSVCEN